MKLYHIIILSTWGLLGSGQAWAQETVTNLENSAGTIQIADYCTEMREKKCYGIDLTTHTRRLGAEEAKNWKCRTSAFLGCINFTKNCTCLNGKYQKISPNQPQSLTDVPINANVATLTPTTQTHYESPCSKLRKCCNEPPAQLIYSNNYYTGLDGFCTPVSQMYRVNACNTFTMACACTNSGYQIRSGGWKEGDNWAHQLLVEDSYSKMVERALHDCGTKKVGSWMSVPHLQRTPQEFVDIIPSNPVRIEEK